MNTFVRFLLTVLLLVLAQESHALACHKDKPGFLGEPGVIDGSITINETIAVPAQLPRDSVLWRSPQHHARITCWMDRNVDRGETVHFWLSPLDPGLTGLGGDLEVGINVNGTDYRCSSSKLKNGCGVPLAGFWIAACPNNREGHCEKDARSLDISYNFFISKLSPASNEAKEGNITGVNSYVIFQIDGEGGINNSKDRDNFRMTLSGLNQLRYVACASTLSINPGTIRFGTINAMEAKPNTIAREMLFSITANKSCNSAYALNAMMNPASNGTIVGGMLVPTDNDSVGITLVREEDRSVIPYDKEFVLIPRTVDKEVVKNFIAQLKWRTDQPKLGAFETGATIDVFYK